MLSSKSGSNNIPWQLLSWSGPCGFKCTADAWP